MLRGVSVFIGRTEELDALTRAVDDAGTGPTGVVVIGEPGSGKSRLLAEARIRIDLSHMLEVVGYQPERNVPLAAASRLLRELVEVPGEGSALRSLLFGRSEENVLDRVRLFEAAHRALVTLTPALLVVDDIHWMDELSFGLCHYLVRAARDVGQPLALFAATRPVEGGAALAEPLDPDRVRAIHLAPLSFEEGVELAMRLDRTLDRGRAKELYDKAQGSPFWLEALARASGAGHAPHGLLTARLRGAGADPGILLGVLAVAGRPLAIDEAAALCGWPPKRAEAALRELEVRGIARATAATAHVAHDLIREAALAELPHETARRIHQGLADSLEARADDDVATLRQALEHRRAAGLPSLKLATGLARSRHRTLLGREGVDLLGSIADEAGPFEPEAMELQEETASLAMEIDWHEEALLRWLRVAHSSPAGWGRARALLGASRAAFELERVAEAREYLAGARREDTGDAILDLEQRTHEAATRMWLEQRTAEGRALVLEAVAVAARLAEEAGGIEALDERARRAYVEALRLEYEAAVQMADAEAMLRVAERRVAAARTVGGEALLTATLSVGVALRLTGRLHEATARSRRVWAEAHRLVLPRLAIDAGVWLARCLQIGGSLLEAEEVILATSRLAARVGDLPRGRHRVALVERSISAERGRPREELERLEAETAAEPSSHQRVAFHRETAVWRARLDGPEAADDVRAHLEAGRAGAEAASCPRCGAELLLCSGEALARVEAFDEARSCLARWDTLGTREDALHPFLRRRAAALTEPDPRRRASALATALADVEGSPYVLEALWTRLDLGLALASAGDPIAVTELQRVAAEAATRGAGTVDELAARALRSLGVRTWRRGKAGRALTKREEEVARMVAEGGTNREIASALFLAPKTVERHVSNVLRKLGVRNRTELAARAGDLTGKSAGDPR